LWASGSRSFTATIGQGEGAFGFGPVGEEAAGLPAHPLLGLHAPLVAAGEGLTSIRRWIDRLQAVAETAHGVQPPL
jgi:hypothetical protein